MAAETGGAGRRRWSATATTGPLEHFLDPAAGLSPATVTRLTKQWQDDHAVGVLVERPEAVGA